MVEDGGSKGSNFGGGLIAGAGAEKVEVKQEETFNTQHSTPNAQGRKGGSRVGRFSELGPDLANGLIARKWGRHELHEILFGVGGQGGELRMR